MRKLLLALILAAFMVGVATPVLVGFLPVTGPVAVHAQDEDPGEDNDEDNDEDTD